jgi:hypothetical protein
MDLFDHFVQQGFFNKIIDLVLSSKQDEKISVNGN